MVPKIGRLLLLKVRGEGILGEGRRSECMSLLAMVADSCRRSKDVFALGESDPQSWRFTL